MIDTPLIRIDRHESGVVEVVLDRPEAMNAVSTQMATALTAAGASLAEDTSVRAVVLTSSHDKAFCVGADLKRTAQSPASYAQAMFLADVTNRPEIMMAHPDWQIVFDFDGDAAAATRRRVLDMVATDRIRVTGYHNPFPANGYVARAGNGFRFVPADWSSAV